MRKPFDVQGHRGARGLKPENTLPSFEIAFDLGVTSVETDVHLTQDGVPVLAHEPVVTGSLFRKVGERVPISSRDQRPIAGLTLKQLRQYCADRNPDPRRFAHQDATVTPLAAWFGRHYRIDPFTPPTLAELFTFAQAYAGEPGAVVGKTLAQRQHMASVRFDLELKRVPFHPESIGDNFTGRSAGLLEVRVVEVIQAADMLARTAVRSFDHRSVLLLRQMEPALQGAVLVAHMAPASPAILARAADALIYCPSFEFLDALQIEEVHAAGMQVLAWTVNEPADWGRLVEWGVDGITTDYPDRLREWLRTHGIS
ncbi:MAG: glycerophosphodiester phosphodiesterase family protein [Gemmataceae bacterium]